AAARALLRIPARPAVLVAPRGLPRLVHPAGVVRGHGVPQPAHRAGHGAGSSDAAAPARSRVAAVARAHRRARPAHLRRADVVPRSPLEGRRPRHRRTRARDAREGGIERLTRRAKRVAIVHYTTPTVLGGVEQVMGVHAAGLRAAGAQVTIVAGRGRAAPKGVRLVRIPEADSRAAVVEKDKAALARGEIGPGHARLVERLVARLRPALATADRVVVHNVLTMPLNLALTAALAKLASERPDVFIAWTHDIAAFDPRYDAFRHDGDPWSLIRRALPNVRYVTVSNERANQLVDLTGLAKSDVEIVTNGVDVGEVLGISN